jgi:hypothetical protein
MGAGCSNITDPVADGDSEQTDYTSNPSVNMGPLDSPKSVTWRSLTPCEAVCPSYPYITLSNRKIPCVHPRIGNPEGRPQKVETLMKQVVVTPEVRRTSKRGNPCSQFSYSGLSWYRSYSTTFGGVLSSGPCTATRISSPMRGTVRAFS